MTIKIYHKTILLFKLDNVLNHARMQKQTNIKFMISIISLFKLFSKGKGVMALLLTTLGFLFIIGHPQKTFAALDNSNVISDNRFVASGTMSEQDIQNFLSSHGSYLATYTVPAARYETWQGTSYYENPWIGPIGNEVNATGWSAAHVIYQVSQWYTINPQVLITTLEKESGLITTSNPSYYGLVQWSMGYAYTEGGILNACGTSTNYNPTGSCAGFAMQVDWGGGALKQWMVWANEHNSSAGIYYTGNTVSIDGQSIYLGNGATAALYRYTPHIQTSFYNIFTSWFSIERAIADNGDQRQWIVDYTTGTRQYIPSASVINAWNLDTNAPLQTMSATTLGSFRDMTDPLGNIIRPSGTLTIYYVNGGRKYPIASIGVFAEWGLSTQDIIDTTANTGSLSITTNTATYLDSNQQQWLIDFTVNTRYYISSGDISSAWGISVDPNNQNNNAPTVSLPNAIFSGIVQGANLGRVVRPSGDVAIYFVDNGTRYHIMSPEMMSAWGISTDSVLNLSKQLIDVSLHQADLGYIVKDPNNTNIYMVDGSNGLGQTILRQYGSPDVLVAWEGNVQNIAISNTFFTSNMTVSADQITTTKIAYNGNEYQVVSGQKLPMSDTVAHLYPGVAQNISDATFNRLVPSAPVVQFIRSYDSTDVYMIDNLKKHKVLSPEILRAWGIGPDPIINIVNSGYLNLIPSDTDLNTYEADVSGQLYLMDGRKITIPANLDTAYRTVNVYSPSTYLITLLVSGENASNFLKGFQTVPIYLMDNAKLRHIRFPADLELLNSGENITSVSQYVLSQFSEDAFVGHYVTDGSTKYLIDHGTKYTVSDSLASEWGLGTPDTLTSATISRFTGSSALTNLFRDSGGNIYLINQGIKRHILGPSVFSAWAFQENQVLNTSDALINTVPTGQYLDILAKTSSSPAIYKMELGIKRHILSPEVFTSLGYQPSMVSIVSSALLDSYNEGSPISN